MTELNDELISILPKTNSYITGNVSIFQNGKEYISGECKLKTNKESLDNIVDRYKRKEITKNNKTIFIEELVIKDFNEYSVPDYKINLQFDLTLYVVAKTVTIPAGEIVELKLNNYTLTGISQNLNRSPFQKQENLLMIFKKELYIPAFDINNDNISIMRIE